MDLLSLLGQDPCIRPALLINPGFIKTGRKWTEPTGKGSNRVFAEIETTGLPKQKSIKFALTATYIQMEKNKHTKCWKRLTIESKGRVRF